MWRSLPCVPFMMSQATGIDSQRWRRAEVAASRWAFDDERDVAERLGKLAEGRLSNAIWSGRVGFRRQVPEGVARS
jgi:hypothetical protein